MTLSAKQIGLTGFWLAQAAISFASQAVIAAYFGTGSSLDAYLVGVSLPTTVYMVVSTGLGSAATLYFNRVKIQESETAAYESISGLLVIVLCCGILLGAVFHLEAELFVATVAPGLALQTEAIRCLQITALSLPFLMLFSLLTGLINAHHTFFITSLAGVLLVGLVPVPMLWSTRVSPEILAWGFNLGALSGCLLLFTVSLRRRHLRPGRIWWHDLKNALSISLPAFSLAAMTHALWLAERYFASSLDPGSISALNYAQRIVNFTAGGLTFATSTVLLPYLSEWIEAGQREQAAVFNRKAVVGTTVCAAAGLVLLIGAGEWLVRLGYARGKFDQTAVVLTTNAIWLYLGVFIAYLYGVVITPNALAMKERKLIISASGLALASYLVVTPNFVRLYGYKGLPLSASVALMLGLAISMAGMWRKHPEFYWTSSRPRFTAHVSPGADI